MGNIYVLFLMLVETALIISPLNKITGAGAWQSFLRYFLGHPHLIVKCLVLNHNSFSFQFLGTVYPGKQVMPSVIGSLSSTWETHSEFLTPLFGVAQSSHCKHVQSEPADRKSLLLFHSLFTFYYYYYFF